MCGTMGVVFDNEGIGFGGIFLLLDFLRGLGFESVGDQGKEIEFVILGKIDCEVLHELAEELLGFGCLLSGKLKEGYKGGLDWITLRNIPQKAVRIVVR